MKPALRTTNRFSAFLSRRRIARRTHPVALSKNAKLILAGAVAVIASVAVGVALVPHGPSKAEQFQAYLSAHAQKLDVPSTAAPTSAPRDSYASTPGIQTLALSGTNYDWAKIVLLSGGWVQSDENVTVITRWMRQENGPDDWWNRNNPLNNGWGASAGAGGTGTYPNLIVAAQKAADALRTHPGYAGIVAALNANAPTSTVESAIWASSWATGHYANGAHWHYTPVPVVRAPASAWG